MTITKKEAMNAYDKLLVYFLSNCDNGEVLLDIKTIKQFKTITKNLLRTVERMEQMKKYAKKRENKPFA